MFRIYKPLAILVGTASVLLPPSANATVTLYQLIKGVYYTQTSDAQPTTPTGYSTTEQVVSDPGDFDSASFSGGDTSVTLSGSNGTFSASQVFGTKSAMDTAVPNGTTYTFSLTGGSSYNGQTATLMTFASDQYPSFAPYLTGTTFDSLQNVNANAAIDLTFDYDSGFGPISVILGPYSNFSIADGVTSLVIPADTLQPGQTYLLYLSSLASAAFSGFTPSAVGLMDQGDITIVTVTTAPVPLPATVWLLMSGLGCLGAAARRRLSAHDR